MTDAPSSQLLQSALRDSRMQSEYRKGTNVVRVLRKHSLKVKRVYQRLL